MATANQAYFDAAIRHRIGLRRYTSGEVREVLALLERADRELTAELRDLLARLPEGLTNFKSRRWRALLDDVRAARQAAVDLVEGKLTADLHALAKVEADREMALLKGSIPVEVDLAAVAVGQLRAVVTSQPFAGHLLKDWFDTLALSDQSALRGALQMGLAQGESIQDIMRRVSGSKANLFRDGTLAVTRRKTEAVVRTAVNHVSNEAREAVWEANEDVVAALRWTSVLDGRTTMICMGRDGKLAPVGDKPLPEGAEPLEPSGARPPAHWGCRSVMVAVIDGIGVLGNRPFVRDTRRPQAREVDFRAEARRTGRPIQEIRDEWAAENIGQIPAATTYQDWLEGQPAEFQDEVLGPGRAELFRKGEIQLDQFTDTTGRILTLADLAGSKH